MTCLGELQAFEDEREAEKQGYFRFFAAECNEARVEVERLDRLLSEVNWYNFEIAAAKWKHPWAETMMTSGLSLHGQAHKLIKHKRGTREHTTFPVYYEGPVADARPCPPLIVLLELEKANKDLSRAELNVTAAYDWAPGGYLYERHIRESEGALAYASLSSNQ